VQLASGTFSTNDGTLLLSINAARALEQVNSAIFPVTCDLSSAAGYAGTLRVLLTATDVRGRQSGTGAAVQATAPTSYVLASRTITVAP